MNMCNTAINEAPADNDDSAASRAIRDLKKIQVELTFRMNQVKFLTTDIEECITLPSQTATFCKSRLEEAVATKSATAGDLRALRRDVKRSTLRLAQARRRELPEARAALAHNANRIAALRALLDGQQHFRRRRIKKKQRS